MNNNLLIAESLVEIANKGRVGYSSSSSDYIFMHHEHIKQLEKKDIFKSLLALTDIGVIELEDKEKYQLEGLEDVDWFDVRFNKEMLVKYVDVVRNEKFFSALKQDYTAKEILSSLKFLEQSIDRPVNISDLPRAKYFLREVIRKIGSYTNLVEIEESLEADVDYSDGMSHFVGASFVPTTVKVLNIKEFKRFSQKIKKEAANEHNARIKKLLSKNRPVEWRCVECFRFLGRLNDRAFISNLLNNFLVNSFKACKKCRTKNYFHITDDGKVKFKSSEKEFEDAIEKKLPKAVTLKGVDITRRDV